MLGELSPAQKALTHRHNTRLGDRATEELYWACEWMGSTLQTILADALYVAARYMKGSLSTHLRMAEYRHMHAWLEVIVSRDEAIRVRDMAACALGHTKANQHKDMKQVTEASPVAENSNDISSNLLSSMRFERIAYAFWRFDNEDSSHNSDSRNCKASSSGSKSEVDQATAELSEPASSVPSVHSCVPTGDTNIPSESGNQLQRAISADEACKELRKLFRVVFEAELRAPVDDQKLEMLLETWAAAHIYITARDYWDKPFCNYYMALKAAKLFEKAVQQQHPLLQGFVPILDYTIQRLNDYIDAIKRAVEAVNARTITPVNKLKFRLRSADKRA